MTAALSDPNNPLKVATVTFAYEVNTEKALRSLGDLRYSVVTRTEIQNSKSERESRCVCKGEKTLLNPLAGGQVGVWERGRREVNRQVSLKSGQGGTFNK